MCTVVDGVQFKHILYMMTMWLNLAPICIFMCCVLWIWLHFFLLSSGVRFFFIIVIRISMPTVIFCCCVCVCFFCMFCWSSCCCLSFSFSEILHTLNFTHWPITRETDPLPTPHSRYNLIAFMYLCHFIYLCIWLYYFFLCVQLRRLVVRFFFVIIALSARFIVFFFALCVCLSLSLSLIWCNFACTLHC